MTLNTWKCNHLTSLGSKGLNTQDARSYTWIVSRNITTWTAQIKLSRAPRNFWGVFSRGLEFCAILRPHVSSRYIPSERKIHDRSPTNVYCLHVYRVVINKAFRHQTPPRYRNAARCVNRYTSRHRSLRPNVTSSTKPEVHNVSQRRQRTTEPRPQGTAHQISWRSVQRF